MIIGQVSQIKELQLGSILSQAATAGDTQLYVEDIGAFEGYDILTIGSETIAYEIDYEDEDDEYITLETALASSYSEEDDVYVSPTVYTKQALIKNGELELEYPVLPSLAPSLPTGIREAETGEWVGATDGYIASILGDRIAADKAIIDDLATPSTPSVAPTATAMVKGFKVDLTYTAPDDLREFEIQHSPDPYSAWTTVAIGSKQTSYNIPNATFTAHKFRFRAIDRSGNESGWSPLSDATTAIQIVGADIAPSTLQAQHLIDREITEVKIKLLLGINMLLNSSFESDGTNWIADDDSTMTYPADVPGGQPGSKSAKITIDTAGSNPEDVIFATGSNSKARLRVENGWQYTLSYYAKAQANRNITVKVRDGRTDTSLGLSSVQAITTSWVKYTHTLTANAENNYAEVAFCVGGASNWVGIDLVQLEYGAAPTAWHDNSPLIRTGSLIADGTIVAEKIVAEYLSSISGNFGLITGGAAVLGIVGGERVEIYGSETSGELAVYDSSNDLRTWLNSTGLQFLKGGQSAGTISAEGTVTNAYSMGNLAGSNTAKFGLTGWQHVAQSFTPNSGISMVMVKIKLSCPAVRVGSRKIYVQLRSDNAGNPGTLLTQTTLNMFSNNGFLFQIPLIYSLVSGTTYWIECYADDLSAHLERAYNLFYDSTSVFVGTVKRQESGTWTTISPSGDAYFGIYVSSASPYINISGSVNLGNGFIQRGSQGSVSISTVGSGTYTNKYGDTTITFPIAYSSAPQVLVIPRFVSNIPVTVHIHSVSATQVSVRVFWASSSTTNVTIDWVAIGTL